MAHLSYPTGRLVRFLACLLPLGLPLLGNAQSASAPPPDRPVALVTGSTDGLGREVALRLAAEGMHVIIHGRNQGRGAAVVAEIEDAGSGSATFIPADLADLEQVRELAAAVLRDTNRLDLLVNNAGIWLDTGNQRQLSADGLELHFAVNYLSGFLLTRLLLPRLIDSAPSRIVNVASIAQTPIDFADPQLSRAYSDSRGYGTSKLAQILFTVDLAEQLAGTGVSVNALHPATLMDTSMVLERGITPRASVEDGAAAVMALATGDDPGTGGYFNGLSPARANAQAYDADARRQLRELSERLTDAPAVPSGDE